MITLIAKLLRELLTIGKARKVTAVDIFSGAGGLSLGFKMAGFKIAAAADMDEYAALTYTHNNPEVAFLRERIEDINGNDILDAVAGKGFDSIDVLIGGPPCQAFSFANRRTEGIDNPNSACVWQFIRLLEEIRPLVFVMENVVGIRSLKEGELFREVVRKAEALGYNTKNEVLCAADFGVPQHRKRNFLIGTRLSGYLPPFTEKADPETVRKAISDLPPLPEGGGADEMNYTKQPHSEYQQKMREGSARLFNHVATKSGKRDKRVMERFKYIPQGGRLQSVWSSLPEHLKKGFSCIENVHNNIYRRLHWDKPAPTIVHVRKAVLIHPEQDRLLSVREAARLQSFPDSYRFFGGISSQYQQVADAVPPLMAKAVAQKVYGLLASNAVHS